jgi:hypothetical protein
VEGKLSGTMASCSDKEMKTMSDRRVFTAEFKREAVRLAKESGNLIARVSTSPCEQE